MREKDITKVIMLNIIEGVKRKRDRPNKSMRCMDSIEEVLKRLGVVNYREMALERNDWGMFLKKAKTHPRILMIMGCGCDSV